MIDKELIHQAAEDIDIFEADLTKEYDRLCPSKPRIIRLWPMAAAACAAGIIAILLMPPKETKVESHFPSKEPMQMWPYDEGLSMIDVQLAYQQEIKEKGERLAAYIQEQQEPINEQY